MYRILTPLLGSICCLGGAHASAQSDTARGINKHGQCLAQVGDTIALDNWLPLYDALEQSSVTNPMVKTPYETQADFQARIQSTRQATRVLRGGLAASYDPYEEAFYLNSLSELEDLSKGHKEYKITLYNSEFKETGRYVGISGWGNTVTRTTTERYSVHLYDRPATDVGPRGSTKRKSNDPVIRLLGSKSNPNDKHVYFGTKNAKAVPATMAQRCGPYGCFADWVYFDSSAESGTVKTGLERLENMFYQDALFTDRTATGETIKSPSVKLKMSKALAQTNDKKISTAFVFTPKSQLAFKEDFDGSHKLRRFNFVGDIHCALVLDKDDKILKVVPTTYGKSAYGPVRDRTPIPGTLASPITQQGDSLPAPATVSGGSSMALPKAETPVRGKPKPLGYTAFKLLRLKNMNTADIKVDGGGNVSLRANINLTVNTDKAKNIETIEYGIIMFKRSNPEDFVVFPGYFDVLQRRERRLPINAANFEGAANNPAFQSSNLQDYDFAAALIEAQLANGEVQRFFNTGSGVMRDLLLEGKR